ncbi:unnamed protein product [Didymodactylos carnosus]|uniref:Uncharacterized protein n=1 Tax=Didymodactylos carnosus TaxID=1234261 RepID=A0A814G3X0_9BILA|nr:unnamed protein product [Didymodactylos carnosus]CAF1235614.1 unnamed protein product [Didymodactylos carnosus]CAF3765016.1 unnamed protein product [Didymodactylos carnosus]CAF4043514.1 unnamed protein product [Didymodactylos carnosus]
MGKISVIIVAVAIAVFIVTTIDATTLKDDCLSVCQDGAKDMGGFCPKLKAVLREACKLIAHGPQLTSALCTDFCNTKL